MVHPILTHTVNEPYSIKTREKQNPYVCYTYLRKARTLLYAQHLEPWHGQAFGAHVCPKEFLGSTQHVHHALLLQALLAALQILSWVSYHSGHSSGDVSCECWQSPQIYLLLNFYLTYFLCIWTATRNSLPLAQLRAPIPYSQMTARHCHSAVSQVHRA